jgi:HK97 family phage portal protein
MASVPLAEAWSGGGVGAALDDVVVRQESGARFGGLGVPAVFASVRLIASTIDQLRLVAPGDPDWLRAPRKYGCVFDQGDLIQYLVASMATRGRAWLHVQRLGDTGWTMQPVPDDVVSVHATLSERGFLRLAFWVAGRPMERVPVYQEWKSPSGRTMTSWDEGEFLLHIPYLVTPEAPAGIGPVQAARVALDGYLAVERQAATLLDGGTYSGGRLETDADITADTARRYQEKWVENRRAGKVPVLGAGLRYVNDLISPKDASWIESRQMNASQVAQMFGIPPDYLGMAMAGGSSSLSYANARDNDRRYRRNCLEAYTTQLGDAFGSLLRVQRDTVGWDWEAWEQSGAERDEDA